MMMAVTEQKYEHVKCDNMRRTISVRIHNFGDSVQL